MMTTIQQSKTIYQCNHCGLECDHPEPDECPRCARTFFVSRRVPTPEWIAEQRRLDVLERATAAQERIERRRQVARDVRKLLTTGWHGYQIVPVSARRTVARRLIESVQH